MNMNLKFNSGEQADTACTTYRSSKKSEISGNELVGKTLRYAFAPGFILRV